MPGGGWSALCVAGARLGEAAMNVFRRASMQLNLSPFERAALRFIELIAVAAAVAGLQAVSPLLAGVDLAYIPWDRIAHTFLAAATAAIIASVLKYFRSWGDAPLPGSPGSPVGMPLSTPPSSAPAAAPAAPVADTVPPVPSDATLVGG